MSSGGFGVGEVHNSVDAVFLVCCYHFSLDAYSAAYHDRRRSRFSLLIGLMRARLIDASCQHSIVLYCICACCF